MFSRSLITKNFNTVDEKQLLYPNLCNHVNLMYHVRVHTFNSIQFSRNALSIYYIPDTVRRRSHISFLRAYKCPLFQENSYTKQLLLIISVVTSQKLNENSVEFFFSQKEYSKELYGMINTKFRTAITSGRGEVDMIKERRLRLYLHGFISQAECTQLFCTFFFIVLLLLYFYTFLYVLHILYYISNYTYYFYDKINSSS